MNALFSRDYLLSQCLLGSIAALWGIYMWRMMSIYWISHVKLTRAANKFPGPPTIPLLGNAYKFATSIKDTFDVTIKISKEYPTCRMWIGPRLFILLTTPRDIEIVMKSYKTSKKSFVYKFMEPLFVNSLLNGHGPRMQANRKFLLPIINGESLSKYMQTVNTRVSCYVDILMKKVNTREFDIFEEMEYCIADLAYEIIFGIPGVAQSHGDLTFSHAVETILQIWYRRSITPWLHPSIFFHLSKYGKKSRIAVATIHEFIYKLVEEKRQLHMKLVRGDTDVTKPKPSILDLWMEHIVKTDAMCYHDIADDLITLFIGFHDTILGVFSFSMLMLAMHSDVQEKVRDEVMSAIGFDDKIMDQNIGELTYTQMVIKETIRLFPVGPILTRDVTDDLEIDQYTIPKGCTVAMIPAVTHRSDKYWNEPDQFIPERFTPENSKDRHPYAYVPFSGGSRSCPGLKCGISCLKIMIAQFVRKCYLTTNMKLETIKLKTHISVRSQNGYKVSMRTINVS